jgi:hypothetical protein
MTTEIEIERTVVLVTGPRPFEVTFAETDQTGLLASICPLIETLTGAMTLALDKFGLKIPQPNRT